MLFAYNPLFRAYNESGLHLVANTLLYPAGPSAAPQQRRPAAPSSVAAARAAAAAAPVQPNLGGEWRPITIEVATSDLARTEAIVDGYTAKAQTATAGGSAYLVIPNPDGLQVDEHPFLRDLLRDLGSADIPLRSVVG
ncbi:hypothetical protein [Intrasporangium sp.]|uniref:hypothetical protein n=1 Tax=Intrasporangium sp. TaxID=1925024 RepID=UPI0032220C70